MCKRTMLNDMQEQTRLVIHILFGETWLQRYSGTIILFKKCATNEIFSLISLIKAMVRYIKYNFFKF